MRWQHLQLIQTIINDLGTEHSDLGLPVQRLLSDLQTLVTRG